MHKNAMKCNKTLSKWCKNKYGASKIIDTFETYQQVVPDSGLEAWYVILHMRDIIKTEQDLLVPERLRKASIDMANTTDAQVRAEFRAIQRTICSIISRDVTKKGGLFHAGFRPPPNAEIETRTSREKLIASITIAEA
jgi:hypothetical protein